MVVPRVAGSDDGNDGSGDERKMIEDWAAGETKSSIIPFNVCVLVFDVGPRTLWTLVPDPVEKPGSREGKAELDLCLRS